MLKTYRIAIWEEANPTNRQDVGTVEAEDFRDALLVAATHIPSGVVRIITTPQRLKEQLGLPKLPWEE